MVTTRDAVRNPSKESLRKIQNISSEFLKNNYRNYLTNAFINIFMYPYNSMETIQILCDGGGFVGKNAKRPGSLVKCSIRMS